MHIERGTSRCFLGQCSFMLILGVTNVGFDPVHMDLDSSTFDQVSTFESRQLLCNEAQTRE